LFFVKPIGLSTEQLTQITAIHSHGGM